MEEKEYRELTAKAFKRLESAFDSVDPDLAEFSFSQGAVTIQFADGSKLILSQQPSVRQIWVAAASFGVALHFDYVNGSWIDDKSKKTELNQFVSEVVAKKAFVHLKIQ